MDISAAFPDLPAEALSDIVDLAEKTAEPQSVQARLSQFHAAHKETPAHLEILTAALTDPDWRRRLVTALGGSAYLSLAITRWPGFLHRIMREEESSPPSFEARQEALVASVLETESWDEAARRLRHHKHLEFLRVGLKDLTGEIGLKEVTGGLSAVASACLEAGYRWIDRDLSRKIGTPTIEQEGEEPRPARFTILGMGKLGAWELNFSSDIDLIFLYDSDEGRTVGPREIAIKAYYARLGRELMKIMHDRTGEGIVFRTDLRLRPEGESGDLCLSTRSAEVYYESWGQTWERSAFIKARPVAGDLELGDDFLENLRPFIYRRYLDFGALESIREMKRKIDRKVTQAEDYHRNLKLGYGGIREIEFFVQCQQLIHGGKIHALRDRRTVPTLLALRDLEMLDGEACKFLVYAYDFLRTAEHRLQIVNEQQVHSLPTNSGEMAKLARRMNFPLLEDFKAELKRVTTRVHEIYAGLFFESERALQEFSDPLVSRLLQCEPAGEPCEEALAKSGFTEPEQAKALLSVLRNGPPGRTLTEAMRSGYDRLAPLLLREIVRAPDPDLAAQHASQFLVAIAGRMNYVALLVENPGVLSLLVKLFGTAAHLSKFLNNHPYLLDNLLSLHFLENFRGRGEMIRDLSKRLAEISDVEERMSAMREFKNSEVLQIGIRDLSGVAELSEVMAGLSAVADAVLCQALIDARAELETRHGVPGWTDDSGARHEAPFAIIAMGKLGGRELNYGSDLDLIFVHGSQGEEQWTDGDRQINNGQFFAKLGQKVITYITTLTREGKLYELDMRLRPSGKSGALVVSLESFRNYQRKEAWTWEHQALTRARVVVGPPEFSHRLKKEIAEVIQLPRDREAIQKEVFEMRERMYRDKRPPEGVIDIKHSRGGIVDVEFLIQFLTLVHAAEHPRLTQQGNASRGLLTLRDSGILSPEAWETLDEGYRFFRLVENRLRLLHDRSENRVTEEPRVLTRLARLCGLEEGENVRDRLTEHMEAVYPIVRHFLHE